MPRRKRPRCKKNAEDEANEQKEKDDEIAEAEALAAEKEGEEKSTRKAAEEAAEEATKESEQKVLNKAAEEAAATEKAKEEAAAAKKAAEKAATATKAKEEAAVAAAAAKAKEEAAVAAAKAKEEAAATKKVAEEAAATKEATEEAAADTKAAEAAAAAAAATEATKEAAAATKAAEEAAAAQKAKEEADTAKATQAAAKEAWTVAESKEAPSKASPSTSEQQVKADAARHAVEIPGSAIEDIAAELKMQEAHEEQNAPATFLDFGDILIQKAMAHAEAAGVDSDRRTLMVSQEKGITEEKRKLMMANHSVAQTCEYTCPGDNEAMPKDLHNATAFADGCGAPGLKVNVDFPFEKCCHSHDICYSSCKKHKNYCDLQFINCMNTTCNTIAPNDQCRHTAVVLFDDTVTLSTDACTSYLGAQEQACDCKPRALQKSDL